jgi:hypothetical protein
VLSTNNEKTFRDRGSELNMQKALIVLGLIILIIGIVWPLFKELPIGKLPGDIIFKKGNFNFYFPLITCLIFSLVITIIINLFK